MKFSIPSIKQTFKNTVQTIQPFKWYILTYLFFYCLLILFYLSPSAKQYFFWNNEPWYQYSTTLYLAGMRLALVIFMLLFLLGLSNMKNHPILAKIIFLSSFYFTGLFLDIF